MKKKTFKIVFARTSVGEDGRPIARYLRSAFNSHGSNLPAVQLDIERFQFRDLKNVGAVWTGTFVKLRDDAPHIVAADDIEHELDLEVGDRVIEKCHFIYRTRQNLLIWQVNRLAGGLSRAEQYFGQLFGQVVALRQLMDEAALEEKLNGHLYEIDFAYDPPAQLPAGNPAWNQDAFDIMNRIDAAHAKFVFRAPRNGYLAPSAKGMVRQLVNTFGAGKIRIKLTEDMELVDLFMAPLKDSMDVELHGRYPLVEDVLEELESAYDRQRDNIAAIPEPTQDD